MKIKQLAAKEELVFATVFEPEQIHILGSKQDIEGFKEFVDNQSNPNTNSIDDIIEQKIKAGEIEIVDEFYGSSCKL